MMGSRIIKIATRSSPLALWQANAVKQQLEAKGNVCELVLIESTGDMQLTQPIYQMGITGVFTKQLDIALINNQADIAVHSLKDVPTQLAGNTFLAAVLERGAHEDIVIVKNKALLADYGATAIIATSSLRRRAQWLARYKKHTQVPIRGNVQTRLRKFAEENIDAVIFAKAGLERLDLLTDNCITLDWMLPAPAQGIIGIVCRDDDHAMKETCAAVNHRESFIAGHVEREFLRNLHGGCSVPISALAQVNGNELAFKGAIHGYDGSRYAELSFSATLADWEQTGENAANMILQQSQAKQLIEEIRNTPWNDKSAID
jgi:hydroxymethylbilane synthase